jgi:hypothetical protein
LPREGCMNLCRCEGEYRVAHQLFSVREQKQLSRATPTMRGESISLQQFTT